MLTQDVDQAIEDTLTQMQAIEDTDTWVISQSGGKDSRVTGQLPAVLIEQGRLNPPKRVVLNMGDTMFEFEAFMTQAKAGLDDLAAKYRALGVETYAFTTMPLPHQDDFWVRIIGYGYMPPTAKIRSCTDKLKIVPVRKVLRNEGWNDAPVLLGVRFGESDRKDKILTCTQSDECGPDYMHTSMTKRASTRQRVVTPIINWRACAVWNFLTLVAPEYDFDNRALCEVYGPDGDMRYGCWTCPLIFQDRTGEDLGGHDPKVRELVRFANSIFRKEGAAWQIENRELFVRKGVAKDGLLTLDFCRRVYDWLIDFERRWDYPLLADWQKQATQAAWAWRESLPLMQAAHGKQLPLLPQDTLAEHIRLKPISSSQRNGNDPSHTQQLLFLEDSYHD